MAGLGEIISSHENEPDHNYLLMGIYKGIRIDFFVEKSIFDDLGMDFAENPNNPENPSSRMCLWRARWAGPGASSYG